jgi:transposase
MDIRSYASEPDRGRQTWDDDQLDARDAVYANRRRIKGERGKRLLRGRGEKLKRSFAHCYETGNMRRLHLRGRDNVAKRVLIHAAGFNLGLLMRVRYGLRKPRSLVAVLCALIWTLLHELLCSTWMSPLTRPIQSLYRRVSQQEPALSAA